MADLTITATSVVNVSAQTNNAIAGETILAGEAIYIKSTDSKAWKAQADGTTEEGLTGVMGGVALNGASVKIKPVVYAVNGAINIGATTVKTTTYVLSALAGKICLQADLVGTNRIVRIGHATGTAGEFLVDVRAIGAVV